MGLHYIRHRTAEHFATQLYVLRCCLLGILHINGNFLLKYLPASCNGAVCRGMDSGILLTSLLTSVTFTGQLVHVIALVIPDLRICYFRFFRDAGYDTGHHPVVEKVRERLSVSKLN